MLNTNNYTCGRIQGFRIQVKMTLVFEFKSKWLVHFEFKPKWLLHMSSSSQNDSCICRIQAKMTLAYLKKSDHHICWDWASQSTGDRCGKCGGRSPRDSYANCHNDHALARSFRHVCVLMCSTSFTSFSATGEACTTCVVGPKAFPAAATFFLKTLMSLFWTCKYHCPWFHKISPMLCHGSGGLWNWYQLGKGTFLLNAALSPARSNVSRSQSLFQEHGRSGLSSPSVN